MDLICDLHTHSVFSDGTYTPAEIIKEAEEIGLSAVALCDHNCVSGVVEFVKAAEGSPVEAIPGIEFSVGYNGKELHILALYIPDSCIDKYISYVEIARKLKEESNILMVQSLKKAGYDVDYNRILAKSSSFGFNRVHVAMDLMDHGYISSIEDGFKTILSLESGHYIPPMRLDSFETLEFIRSTGAVSVLAHAFLNLEEFELREFLKLAVPHGLGGMETLYSEYDRNLTEKSIQIAQEFGLLQSGGSDFHGANKPDIKLGFGRNNLRIPFEFAKQIKAATNQENL